MVCQTNLCLNSEGSTENTHIPQLSFGMLGVPRLFSTLLETNSCQLLPWSANFVRLKCNIQSALAFFFCKSLLSQDEQLGQSKYKYKLQQIQITATACMGSCCCTLIIMNRHAPTGRQPGQDNILGLFKGLKVISPKGRNVRRPILCTGNTHNVMAA